MIRKNRNRKNLLYYTLFTKVSLDQRRIRVLLILILMTGNFPRLESGPIVVVLLFGAVGFGFCFWNLEKLLFGPLHDEVVEILGVWASVQGQVLVFDVVCDVEPVDDLFVVLVGVEGLEEFDGLEFPQLLDLVISLFDFIEEIGHFSLLHILLLPLIDKDDPIILTILHIIKALTIPQ